jgi:ABC-type bacteriocin/lantibiotic exporter with double-glycine peptidase domain
MLLAHYGRDVTESELRRATDLSEHGTHIEELHRVANLFGLKAHIDEGIDLDQLEESHAHGRFPIVYFNRQPIDGELSVHSVVVTRVTRRFVSFLDPLRGERRVSRPKFMRAWSMLNRLALVCESA